MWVTRELSRLLVRIMVAVAIASLIAIIKAVASGGGFLHTWQISLLALGGPMFLLADDPSLTASAVFVGSGVVLLALGLLA